MDIEKPFPSRVWHVLMACLISVLLVAIPFAIFNIDFSKIISIEGGENVAIIESTTIIIFLCTFFIVLCGSINTHLHTPLYKDVRWSIPQKLWKTILLYILILSIVHILFLCPLQCVITKKYGVHREALSLFFIGYLFIVPLFEEIVFRMTILNGLQNRYRPHLAILFTSLLFMLIHSPKMYIPAFIVGFALGTLFQISKNISACIIVHIIVNLLSTTIFNHISYCHSPLLCWCLISIFISLISITCIIIFKRGAALNKINMHDNDSLHFTTLAEYTNDIEAEMILQLLLSHEIHAVKYGSISSRPYLNICSPIKIMVPNAEYEEAVQIIGKERFLP